MKLNSALAHPRLHGLDTLRAFAIIIVLIYHYKVVVTRQPIFGFMSELGWTGVDLFFVLSGYLIGNQVLSSVAIQNRFSLKYFFIRRGLRTLPNYLLILTLYWLCSATLGGKTTAPWWSFLTFTQNINMHPGETFTHSWSLCIEEQFYVIFPLLVLFIAYTRRSVLTGWLLLGILMLVAILVRMHEMYTYGGNHISSANFYAHIYYSSFGRFDELLPGIAIAMIKNFHKQYFDRLLEKSNGLVIVGLAAIAALYYAFYTLFYQAETGVNLPIAILGYPLLAISFGIITLAALSPKCWLNKVRIPGATSIALWSYAIYLIHKPIFQLLKQPLAEHGLDLNQPVGVTIIMLTSILAGWGLFILVETPFMKLRAQYYPSNRKPAILN